MNEYIFINMTKYTPYWWEGQPNYSESNRASKNADVVIVGAGFTGLSAAITLAKIWSFGCCF